MAKKSRTKKALKKAKFEIGTLKHALRTEMSQALHWVLIISVAIIAGIQVFLLTTAGV